MPSDPTASPSDLCAAISFGWALDAEPARLAVGPDGGVGVSEGDAGCL